MRPACGCSLFVFPMGWYGVCEIEMSYMSKHSGNPDLVCENWLLFAYKNCEGKTENLI